MAAYIVERLMDIELSHKQDSFWWGLTILGFFSVKSMYLFFWNEVNVPRSYEQID
jgi:hypothetical protein